MKENNIEENIDKRIERVIESVGSKRAAMRQWETDTALSESKRRMAIKRWRTYGISAAASLVVICGIGLGLYLNHGNGEDYVAPSSSPLYRSSGFDVSEIETMIDNTNYDDALLAIDITLADTLIDASFTQERQDYLRIANKNREYELMWLKINILLKAGRTAEAISMLNEYKDMEGVHKDDAEKLLNKLNQ